MLVDICGHLQSEKCALTSREVRHIKQRGVTSGRDRNFETDTQKFASAKASCATITFTLCQGCTNPLRQVVRATECFHRGD